MLNFEWGEFGNFYSQWHSLSRDEQAKYYELARKERQIHMQLYPGWSARDNYAQSKKRKRKRLQEKAQATLSKICYVFLNF